jgi:hypothetical protein
MSESASAVVLGYVKGKAVITPRDRLYLDEIGRRFGTQAMRSGGMLFLPMTTRTGRHPRCQVATPFCPSLAPDAARLEELAVHVDDPAGPCTLMQVIDVLSAQEQVAAPFREGGLNSRQGKVGGVRLGTHFQRRSPPLRA